MRYRFLIGWGGTPHPAEAAPRAGTLLEFHIEHPDPESVRAALASLGVDVEVRPSESVALVARIEGERAVVELR